MHIIGIDLGTTYSLVSYFDGQKAVVIPNALGKNMTPSIVSVDEDNNVFVGDIAKEMLITNPENTVKLFKRTMGMKKEYTLNGKGYSSIELSSFIIKSLKEDAEKHLGEKADKVVISVPAYFNDLQRKATKMAGELAGLEVVRIISEPTAASLLYGVLENNQESVYLIFDLGGGTFDVSILEMNDSIIEILSIAGDNYLGGEDFTLVLAGMFLEHFDMNEFEVSSKNLNTIVSACEKAKINIENDKLFKINCVLDDKEYKYNVSFEDFTEACEPLLEKIKNIIAKALIDAKKKVSDIDNIVLVGGATKLSLVRTFTTHLFKKIPISTYSADEVVALGVAVQCGMIERSESIKEVILTDVCSYTLGTSVSKRQENGLIKSGYYLPIIERNTTIPVSKVERLYTLHDMQSSIKIEILQGESFHSHENLLLGTLEINVPKKPAGEECVDVRYTYNINGILEVIVEVISTGKKEKIVLEKSKGLFTEEEINEKLEEISHLKIHPKDKEQNKLVLQKAKSKFEQSLNNDRVLLAHMIFEYESALDSQDSALISTTRRNLEKYLQE